MSSTYSVRYASHPADFKSYDTQKLRELFLIEDLFSEDAIKNVYSHYDRLIIGGAMPKSKPVALETFVELKASFYLERRELGIINVGPAASVIADGTSYLLKNKEALYIGKGTKEVVFHPSTEGQAHFYFNSAPAHMTYPTRKVSLEQAEKVELGALETSNHRTINKLIVNSVLPTCQLQMGLTELKPGSVWNTLPPHTHDRRMEAYFYFDVPENQVVAHFMGQPDETRHLWVKNNQAIISPPWSIHSGAGTSNYTFIWGMAGENLDYGDMDGVKPIDLK
ncbi:MAG: 5-dehydro-4-deoxy-D-glucuronate isomerase [Azospira oryzae]|jgi:4-deoxy-L-threo-5-hexosulose-uronate ketol-isomerase|nr:MAG: 5-dehydro-4-deoxy-D-glucuronate isomerase [Azospira oryzae]